MVKFRIVPRKIYAYAIGDADERAAFDLDSLPDHVGLSLLSLSEAQLAKLTAAGPTACGRWGLGERTGLVDVPVCNPKPRTVVVGESQSVTSENREPSSGFSLAA